MKNILTVLLLMPFIVFAKEPPIIIKPLCVDVKQLDELLTEFNEIPFARGLSQRGEAGTTSLVIFISKEKRTWSIVEKISSDVYCVIAVGNDFEPVPTETIDQREKQLDKRKGNIL